MKQKNNLLEIKNLNKSFGDKKILKDINLVIKPNRIVGLLGKNGSGKTTLVKIINDLLTIDSGEVLVDGKHIGVETKKIVSYLPDSNYLCEDDKIIDAINFFADFFVDFEKERAIKMIQDFDIDINQYLSKLSKGMKEKVCLSLVMSRNAKLYILDEPIGGVDPASRDYILDVILKNFSENASLIISTHMISDIERILDDVIFLNDGEIVLNKEADELRNTENSSIDETFRRMFYVK